MERLLILMLGSLLIFLFCFPRIGFSILEKLDSAVEKRPIQWIEKRNRFAKISDGYRYPKSTP